MNDDSFGEDDPLEELLRGLPRPGKRDLPPLKPARCPMCRGTGMTWRRARCFRCKGTGMIPRRRRQK